MSEIKSVYFIRHGQTNKNKSLVHQSPNEHINENGKSQAADLAQFLVDKNIDTIICSDYKRAVETAGYISERLGIEILQDEVLREFMVPVEIHGRNYFSLPSLGFFFRFSLGRNKENWKDDGSENMFLIRNRVEKARLTIENLSGKNIAVVSHRIFMTSFAETVCFRKPISLYKFIICMMGRDNVKNTGILRFSCQRAIKNNQCNWFLEETLKPPYKNK